MPTDATVRAWHESFGSRLRMLRDERSLSQGKLADVAGVERKLVYPETIFAGTGG